MFNAKYYVYQIYKGLLVSLVKKLFSNSKDDVINSVWEEWVIPLRE